MQILIKVVQGNGFMIDVDENITVLDLKKKIEQRTQHLVEQQTLLLVGRALVDDKQLSFYPNIKEGTKINLVLKKLNKESLNNVLIKFLKNYYSESQSNQICDKFMKNFEQKVSTLSLDDLERIATTYLNEENGKCTL